MTIGLAANQASPEATVNTMVDGHTVIDVAGGSNVNLSDLEATHAVVELTGVLTGDISVSIPDVKNTIAVANNTSGAFTLTFKSLTGAGVAITQGAAAFLYCDGTDVKEIQVTSTVSSTITGKTLISNVYQASTPSSSSGTLTLNLANGHEFNVTLTEAVTTLAFSSIPAGVSSITLDITQDGTGGWAITWPASVKWHEGTAPTLTTTAAANSVITMRTKDSGTTWQAFLAGDDIK